MNGFINNKLEEQKLFITEAQSFKMKQNIFLTEIINKFIVMKVHFRICFCSHVQAYQLVKYD